MLVPIAFFALVFVVGGILLISSQSLEAKDDNNIYRICETTSGFASPNLSIAWSCGLNDSAYCTNPNGYDCVKNGTCYNGYLGVFSGLNNGGNDNAAVCCYGDWLDCDYAPNACDESICGQNQDDTFGGVQSGESGVGEYQSAGSWGCCGDDKNEYFKQGRDGTKACCNSKSDIVVNGKCYAKNKVPAVR